MVALFWPAAASAAQIYAHWTTVTKVRYVTNGDLYLVQFSNVYSGFSSTCDRTDWAIINVSTDGVATTQETADRLMFEIQMARALGLRVQLWVHGCSLADTGQTFPKAYRIYATP